jgi:hypothetical protein
MTLPATLLNEIKKPTSKIFRRFLVKRRQVSDGLFESTWQDLSQYVKRWGSFKWAVDTPRFGDFKFHNANLRMLNIDGTFNPNDNLDSFWNGYGDIQRTLVKIEAGFTHQTQAASGIWTNTEFPSATTLFTGIISGDIGMSGRGEIVIPIKPITQVFRDYPANDLNGFTTTGISAGGFFNILRDHTDGSSNYVFRPYIGNGASATEWSIATGGQLYANLDSAGTEDLHQLDCWDVASRISQAEQGLAHINREGKFIWQYKTATAAVQYEFHGLGSNDRNYGQTIKKINNYGKRLTSFYSRVAVKYTKEDTNTSFVNTALAFAVSGTNTAWNLGQRTFSIENFWLANSAAAASVASYVFNEVSNQAEEINFTSTFVPQLNLLDRISVTYDATDFVSGKSFWDINAWDTTTGDLTTALIWDDARGDGIILSATEFRIISINHNLDKMESTFIAKQLS